MFLQFYGLNEQPFGVTPDPRFLYMGPAQQEAFSSLVYGIETGRGFMTLIAGPGLGKTTILLRLMERLRESARTAFLFQTHTNSLEFLRNLLADLDIKPARNDLGELQRQLGDVLIQEARAGRRLVVAIDEAQNLDSGVLEMVRMLSNFETPQAKLLQIVLVGQPQLAEKLASPPLEQLRQRISIITYFPPLTGDEVIPYIEHRLRVAGYVGKGLFTPAALAMIGSYSKGIPRNINNLCFQALSLGYAKNQKKIDDAILREVISDLSLESLATPMPAASETAPPSKHSSRESGDRRMGRNVDTRAQSRPFALGAMPSAHSDKSSLDSIPLSPQSGIGDVSTLDGIRGIGSRRVSSRPGRKRETGAFAWVAAAAILVGVTMWPWLKPGFDSLDHFIRAGEFGPKHAEVANVPVPVPAATNPTAVQTEPPEDVSNRNEDSSGADSNLEYRAPDTLPVRSQAPGRADSPASTTNIGSYQTPETHSSPVPGPRPTGNSGSVPGSGRLVVESSVSGARITLNGESDPKWTTPRLFSLAPGIYRVSVFRPGFEPWTKSVRLREGGEQFLTAELADLDGGIFTVDTDPPGMQVFIDGKSFGPSRVDTVLRSGWHVCAVIPGPGLQAIVSRFHLKPGEAVTRRIRMDTPAGSSQNAMPQRGTDVTTLATGPQGGMP